VSDFDLSGAVLDGRYKVISPISEGAMGSVYRGERVQLGRAVAIKVMHEALPDELSSRQRFEREAKLMAMLEHPNCVSVIDFGVHDDKPFLVMELVRGTSLQELIDKHHHIDIPRAAAIMRQVLSGLAHAHELGIIHRDIKPANIMVTEQTGLSERVRILDFGLARLTDTSTKLTTGIVVGTPNYMAPEQCKGGDLDGRTDVYACGVMLFELLTGRKPFVADDPIAVVRKHISEPPPRLADVVPGVDFGEFEAIVARALAKDPNDRFESAEAMSAAIENSLKKGVAQVFARAVPGSLAAAPQQVATPSGWNLPAGVAQGNDSAPMLGSSALIPEESLAIARAPNEHSAPIPRPQADVSTAPVARPTVARKHLAIGTAAVLGVIAVIAIVASSRGHHAARPTTDAAVATGSAPGDPVPALLAHANELAQAGDPEAALSVLTRAHKEYPDSAPLAVAAGKLYFAKLWWTDGIKSFREAIRLDPSLRSDPDLIKTVLRGFNTTPEVDDRIESFIREDLGATAKSYLQETASSHPNKQIRARAAAELRRLR
jgi:eukaryotic-like serine/threonine-protein kinase